MGTGLGLAIAGALKLPEFSRKRLAKKSKTANAREENQLTAVAPILSGFPTTLLSSRCAQMPIFIGVNSPHAGLIVLIRRRSRVAECAALLGLIASAGGNINFA